MEKIKLGYEIPTGEAIEIQPSHLIVTGLTQLSGKTTTLEALITRSGLKAVVFRTKPGERGFSEGNRATPYFKEKSDWQYVSSLLEATLKEKLKFERSWIMNVCKGTSSLLEVKRNIEQQLANPKLSGLNRSVYTTLDEYLNLIMPQISVTVFSQILELQPGVNVMNLERLKDELQSLVIRSVLETVLYEMNNVIVVIPEAWKFLPQGMGNPCKQAAEKFIRQGATNNNFLWIDSQDIAGIDKTPLKSVSTWILGYQSELNEVRHTLNQMPIPKKLRPGEDELMRLPLGHFYLCTQKGSKKVYVQPVWLDNDTAVKISKGEEEIPQGKNTSFELKKLNMDLVYKPMVIDPLYNPLEANKKLSQEINELRKDFFDKLKDFYDALIQLNNLINSIKPEINEDLIISKILQKIPVPKILPVAGPAKPVYDMETIIAEVIKRMPPSSGSVTYQVAPLDKIKRDFIEEIRLKIVNDIKTLSPDEKKALRYIESKDAGIAANEVITKCFFWAQGQSTSVKMSNIFKPLSSKEFIEKTDGGRYKKGLKKCIEKYMTGHDATAEEIELLYNYLLTELI